VCVRASRRGGCRCSGGRRGERGRRGGVQQPASAAAAVAIEWVECMRAWRKSYKNGARGCSLCMRGLQPASLPAAFGVRRLMSSDTSVRACPARAARSPRRSSQERSRGSRARARGLPRAQSLLRHLCLLPAMSAAATYDHFFFSWSSNL
jgi:hypothetical protein